MNIYRGAVVVCILVWFGHVISLPLGITYDGHVYIDLTDVLGSNRFPGDWSFARTPLFPCALKISFALFGKQPLAAMLVSSAAGMVGTLALGAAVATVAGSAAGAVVLLLLSFFPTLVAYQHFVLTEAGTFCFLALILSVLVWEVEGTAAAWRKTLLLAVLLGAGYYWRQNILGIAPLVAVLHAATLWRSSARAGMTANDASDAGLWKHWAVICQALVVVTVPYALAQPWRGVSDDRALSQVMVRFGVIKQALLPPEDPLVGEDADAYRKAIAESTVDGHMYSGIRADLHAPLTSSIFSRASAEDPLRFALGLVRKYPRRYVDGVARTVLLFAGARVQQSENQIFRDQILSPTALGSMIGDGPPQLDAVIKREFAQRTTPSTVLAVFRVLAPVYDWLVPVAWGASIMGIGLSLALRSMPLFAFCILPWYYVLPYALTLGAVDRYAFPVYPILLAGTVVTAGVAVRHLAARTQSRSYALASQEPSVWSAS